MVYTSPKSPYIKLFESFLSKKKRLAVDSWGADTTQVQSAFDPIEQLISKEVTHITQRYPPTWKVNKHGTRNQLNTTPLLIINPELVGRLVRNILISEELTPEYASHFEGLSLQDLDELAASFKFENCVQRLGLNKVLRDHAHL
jgi:hypothetical protein